MKDDLGLYTKEAIRHLLLALRREHPEILRNGGDIRSEDSINFLITISKLEAGLESYQGTEFFKSLSISALGAGAPCPNCRGTGKV
ncbi:MULTISPECIES: hypothetical protein [Enterobacteriaceae]|uniref:hypothetical protein n=1 Tax=Enterobacteriaceae TaxID=543 RepID=UPI0011E4D80A|nr:MULTISPECIES: hypothetical protein [Enterobacteriaceae]QLW09437.1 hypothetical protein HV159_00980 [Escherichia coli]HCM9437089.1 hypothetical protein [Enterobacter hormaechei subsp. xiangfangensis]ELT9740524.1 hypothetical protein [Klebsiella michiganensis]MBU9998586.1 hypothetical protein [Klebsiella michiganensis]MBZ7768316.1 hypothetical protein [Klebsiella michiganensis]